MPSSARCSASTTPPSSSSITPEGPRPGAAGQALRGSRDFHAWTDSGHRSDLPREARSPALGGPPACGHHAGTHLRHPPIWEPEIWALRRKWGQQKRGRGGCHGPRNARSCWGRLASRGPRQPPVASRAAITRSSRSVWACRAPGSLIPSELRTGFAVMNRSACGDVRARSDNPSTAADRGRHRREVLELP